MFLNAFHTLSSARVRFEIIQTHKIRPGKKYVQICQADNKRYYQRDNRKYKQNKYCREDKQIAYLSFPVHFAIFFLIGLLFSILRLPSE